MSIGLTCCVRFKLVGSGLMALARLSLNEIVNTPSDQKVLKGVAKLDEYLNRY